MGRPTGGPVVLDGERLTLEDLERVANGASVTLEVHAVERLSGTWEASRASSHVAYGRDTGVGALGRVGVPESEQADASLTLLRSHAGGPGRALPEAAVRAGLAVRANQLLAPGACASPDLLGTLVAACTAAELPSVTAGGSVGTGDLAGLATIGCWLAGQLPTSPAPAPRQVTFGPGEGLALVSSSALSLARLALATLALERLGEHAVAAAALAAVALGAAREALDPRFVAVVGREADVRAADELSRWLGGSAVAHGPLVQDPYPLRCLPSLLGALRVSLARVRESVEGECNRSVQNPLWVRSLDGGVIPAHHGSFLTIGVTQEVEALLRTLARWGGASMGRLALLLDGRRTGLADFVGGGEGADPGLMILEYLAAGEVGRLRWAAAGTGDAVLPLSLGTETLASWLPLAAEQAELAAGAWPVVVACEALGGLDVFSARRAAGASASAVLEEWAGWIGRVAPPGNAPGERVDELVGALRAACSSAEDLGFVWRAEETVREDLARQRGSVGTVGDGAVR
jgi:histidine ammonia-lyase